MAHINVIVPLSAGTLAVEVEGDGPALVLEIGGSVVILRRVDARPEVDGGLPAEVIVIVLAVGGPDVHAPTAAGAVAPEVDPVAVRGERRRVIVPGTREGLDLSRRS